MMDQPTADQMDVDQQIDPPLPITEHLRELRTRLVQSSVVVLIAFIGCYTVAEELYYILLAPLSDVLNEAGRGEMIFTSLTEPFMVYLKIAFLAALLVSSPILAVEAYIFLKPAFRGKERAYTVVAFFIGGVLFSVGALFGYFVVFPFGFQFLLQIVPTDFLPKLSINEYFSLASRMLFVFGLVFEMPLVFSLLARMGLVDGAFFSRNRRIAILIIFIGAAILTPPDVMTQMLLAIPLIILYEVSGLLARILARKPLDPVEEDYATQQPQT